MAVDTEQIATNSATPTALFVQGTTSQQFQNVTGTSTEPLPAQVKNMDATITIYLGANDVTSGNGYPLLAGQSISFNFIGNEATTLYAISASATPNVAILVGRQ